MGETCENCRFWKRGFRSERNPFIWLTEWPPESGTVNQFGECRHHPPGPTDDGCNWSRSHEDDWCGEHQPIKPEAQVGVNAELLAALKDVFNWWETEGGNIDAHFAFEAVKAAIDKAEEDTHD